MTPVTEEQQQQQPPQKRIKRAHTISSNDSASPTSPSRRTSIKFFDERPKSASGRVAENTPPPSPRDDAAQGQPRIDTDSIDDEIVVGVIKQLEKTGNRPHMLKELAAILTPQLQIVARYVKKTQTRSTFVYDMFVASYHGANVHCSSANPAAIISSRLINYQKRNWTALSPCPIGRTLVGTHPKRIYFFLTTCEHQAIPTEPTPASILPSRIISPSLSSAADEESSAEDPHSRARAQLSPSPEVDLSSPEFDDHTNTSTPFAGNMGHPPTPANISHNRRAQSPPIEKDEREFTQVATSLQQRSLSENEAKARAAKTKSINTPGSSKETSTPGVATISEDSVMEDPISQDTEETEESAALKNSEAAAALFGPALVSNHLAVSQPGLPPTSSPLMRPAPLKRALDVDVKMEEGDEWNWSELKSPECVALDELDEMFGGY
jgi:hypothetical protein